MDFSEYTTYNFYGCSLCSSWIQTNKADKINAFTLYYDIHPDRYDIAFSEYAQLIVLHKKLYGAVFNKLMEFKMNNVNGISVDSFGNIHGISQLIKRLLNLLVYS